MKKLALVIMLLSIMSCGKNEYTYYVSIIKEDSEFTSLNKEEFDTISVVSDSAAYCYAYQTFLLSKGIDDMFPTGRRKTLAFKLLNDRKEDITDKVSFLKKDSIVTNIEQSVKRHIAGNKESLNTSKNFTNADIDNQFSKYDGSHKKTEEYVQSHMKNPDSYEHVSSQYKIHDDYLEVVLTYRGTNSYGAVVTEKVKAKCNLSDGEVLSATEL